MATSHKTALKAAKAALDSGHYQAAVEHANKVLRVDTSHYHANVFRGLALEKQGELEAAEDAYNKALESNRGDALAWQGLVALYQQQADKKIHEYAAAAQQLAEVYMRSDDITRCQTVIDKFVSFAKQHGTKSQYRQALELILPTSPLYDYLEGRLPQPGITFPKIAEIVEADEKQRINKLVGERKTRLGARVGQVTEQVKREVYASSDLESVFQQVINWTSDDDIRRLYEEKLLQRAYDTLTVLPTSQKLDKIPQVQQLAGGMVIIKHPFHLAWKIFLEWKDVEDLKEMEVNFLLQFVELFPTDGLSKILSGFLLNPASPFTLSDDDCKMLKGGAENEPGQDPIGPIEEEILVKMTDGLEESSRSMLSQRIMAEYYLILQEYASAVDAARKARDLIVAEKQATGLPLQFSLDGVNNCLGNALVQYQTPRYHNEARELFEDILQRSAHNTRSLIGIGLIYEEEEQYAMATEFFTKTLQNSPDVKIKAEAGWCRALEGDYSKGFSQIEECIRETESEDHSQKAFKAQCMYRLGVCKWNLDSLRSARKDRKGAYSYFLAALQLDLDYAPAYTSLGIYYSDYARDWKRARKCFQKAFELSSVEVEAAERLAMSFAEQAEWDLVEVVAQRVIDSGKTRAPPGSRKKGIGWPFTAIGICQINSLEYAKAIVSFQTALRSHPEDVNSWIGLGESYHNSGRYISAVKAFQQVHELQEDVRPDNDARWFARYMLASVRRELGQFDEAIGGFEEVLELKPTDIGVSIALLQTRVECGWHDLALGLFGRAAQNGIDAIKIARSIVSEKTQSFTLWKAVGDSCALFTWLGSSGHNLPHDLLLELLRFEAVQECFDAATDTDHIGLQTLTEAEADESTMEPSISAIFASKRAVYCTSTDIYAQAVAWYNLGWSEYRAYCCQTTLSSRPMKRRAIACLKAAVKSFKRAIELEPGNSEFWNALGIATTTLNPKVAQHALCRSLYLNGNLAKVWTNLGTLYLIQNDIQLATEAFNRGQSTDPDYASAWIGQGLISLLSGAGKEAYSHFSHAFEVSDSTDLIAKQLYASSSFDQVSTTSGWSANLAGLLEPLFALQQLQVQEPRNLFLRHLSALMAERVSGTYDSVDDLSTVCAELESRYELSEADEDLERFVQGQADLARTHLAQLNYVAASEHAHTAIDLSEDFESGDATSRSFDTSRLSAHLTAGLAHHFLGQHDEAILMFRTALIESKSSPDIVCLLAQVLWAKGEEEERATARDQLLDCIEHNPDHAGAITLLSVLAVLDDDQETLEAVSLDLHNLRSRSDVDEHRKLSIGSLLSAVAAIDCQPGDQVHQVLAEAMTSVMLAPHEPHGWAQLASASGEESNPAEMGVLTALASVPPMGVLTAEELARAYADTGKASDAQRSIMTAPWKRSAGWETLDGLVDTVNTANETRVG